MGENKINFSEIIKVIRELFKGTKTEEKAKNKAKQILAYAAGILLLLVLGFFGGRLTIKEPGEPEVIYLPGEPIYIPVPAEPDSTETKPVYIVKPIDTANVIAECIRDGKYPELFPVPKDSIIYVTKEDTAAVLKDWAAERYYKQKVFDIDTVGSAVVEAKSQYNRITWIGTTFTPVTKQVVMPTLVRKKYSPFIGGGITTMPEIVVNGGMYFDDKYGASLMYEYDWTRKKHAVGVMGTIKF